MSFYQPSLSLYDVLNALANQNQARQQERPGNPNRGPTPQVHPFSGRGPHPHHHSPFGTHGHPLGRAGHHLPPHGHHGNPHRHSPPVFGFPGSDPFQPTFGLPNYGFSRMPQQGYYYSPQYEYEDEDEEDMDKGGDRKDEQEENEETQQPSYYHDESGKYNRGYEQENPTLTDILNALLGGAGAEESADDENAKTATGYADENDIKQPEKNEDEEKKDVEESTAEETVVQPEPEKVSTKDTTGLEKPTRSFAHLSAPTPIPDPLQISKPETRLDLPFSPEVNVYNLDKEYIVVLALPGANSKSFKIDYHPSSHELLVKGKVIDRLGIEEQYLKITEIKYGAFERTVKFPVLPRIKDEEIKATYSNGLLQIKVPKLEITEKPKPKKRITIEDIPDAELEFEENPNPVTEI
ncbi:hypothetical protein C6P45_004704 [Maudiozyma exigua]|uniref:SHSP domain-containing protein n=1 Tax=Maudiozyma exigua TaxID=34358 RepID=A0A9P6WAP6_MAUEX|nr:hypothetical protein C6P45_004704 [Kazachstania exigua]